MDAAAVLKERFPLREITPEKYRTMGNLMMRFHLEQYAAEGLGNLCGKKCLPPHPGRQCPPFPSPWNRKKNWKTNL